MFEVGKQYKSRFFDKVYQCLFAGEHIVVLTADSIECHTYQSSFGQYTEYKEPIKLVQYVNIYRHWSSTGYNTRQEADAHSDGTRIGCKRVEITYTEGEFDE